MPLTITLDHKKPLADQADKGHNRMHPDIAPIARVQPGDQVVMDTLDASDAAIQPGTTLADLEGMVSNAHPLTGPIYVEGAEPGDLLAVQIEHIAPQPYGFTRSRGGFGFLRDEFTGSHLTMWDIKDGHATSPDLPGVRIQGAPFMGVMAVALSHEMHDAALKREAACADAGGVALPPRPEGAIPAHLGADALRTAPPRENAGNVDIRHLVAGTTAYFPVFTEGAMFSVGDAHYAQGDGEVCGTAIEMGATFTGRLGLIKGGAGNSRDMSFQWEGSAPPPGLNLPSRYYATTGICVRRDGTNLSEDASEAARNALRNMIAYIVQTYGYSEVQAYHICSVAVNLKLSQVVDLPNILVSAVLPLDIFVGR